VKRKAIIVGIRGIKLSSEEIYLLKKEKPWGVILFSRNIKNLTQLKKLIIDIKNCIKDKNYPILIDQEGGRVSRLNKIIDLSIFSQGFFGNFYKNDRKTFYDYYKIYIDTVCEIIKKVGININTVPVLDVRRKNSHSIIGNRSFSSDASIVSKMGNLCINLYSKNKIATVIKHIPGHGLAKCDSHRKLPVINTKKNELIKKDFIPFKNCKSPFAMTAHVIYSIYDPINTATHSRIVINEIIRKHIGFRGILISDDISMKALRYGLKDNATKALDAGCNLILHSNGNIQEMSKLTKIIPTIDKFTQKKTSHFYNFLR
jgi:beta-N-acetylhexosaminidase|tara:strand:- start:1031 stop:1978 length:948 start_codon:yes stop_codon:yes gene_type:complete